MQRKEESFISRQKIFALLLLPLCLVFLALYISNEKKEVTLIVDGEMTPVTTWQKTVNHLFEELKLETAPQDSVVPSLESALIDGMEIEVITAREVSVYADGTRMSLITTKKEMSAILTAAGVYLGSQDRTHLTKEAGDITAIQVKRVEVLEEKEEIELTYETEQRNDRNLLKGKTTVLKEGEAGLREKTYQVVYVDGKESERSLISDEIIKEPRNKVVAVGIKEPAPVVVASRSDARVASTQTGEASWYGYDFAGNRTASGEIFNPEALTAAHPSLPFNTVVRVTYSGRHVDVRINDRGPHTGGRIIDLSRAAAEAIGLRRAGVGTVTVDVLK